MKKLLAFLILLPVMLQAQPQQGGGPYPSQGANQVLKIFNVNQYGASTAATDVANHTAIQAAITAASVAGGVVYFPDHGTYQDTGPYVVGYVDIPGSGVQRAAVTIRGNNNIWKCTATSGIFFLGIVNWEDICLQGQGLANGTAQAVGNYGPTNYTGIYSQGPFGFFHVENLTVCDWGIGLLTYEAGFHGREFNAFRNRIGLGVGHQCDALEITGGRLTYNEVGMDTGTPTMNQPSAVQGSRSMKVKFECSGNGKDFVIGGSVSQVELTVYSENCTNANIVLGHDSSIYPAGLVNDTDVEVVTVVDSYFGPGNPATNILQYSLSDLTIKNTRTASANLSKRMTPTAMYGGNRFWTDSGNNAWIANDNVHKLDGAGQLFYNYMTKYWYDTIGYADPNIKFGLSSYVPIGGSALGFGAFRAGSSDLYGSDSLFNGGFMVFRDPVNQQDRVSVTNAVFEVESIITSTPEFMVSNSIVMANSIFSGLTVLGTDQTGKAITYSGGPGTGTGRGGAVLLKTAPSLTTGTTQGTLQTRTYISAKEVALTQNTVTLVANITLPTTLKNVGVHMVATTRAINATDVQARTDDFVFSAVNKAGTVTPSTPSTPATSVAVSAGTLTSTWTVVANGTSIDVKQQANSSITPTALGVSWRMELDSTDTPTVTPQ